MVAPQPDPGSAHAQNTAIDDFGDIPRMHLALPLTRRCCAEAEIAIVSIELSQQDMAVDAHRATAGLDQQHPILQGLACLVLPGQ